MNLKNIFTAIVLLFKNSYAMDISKEWSIQDFEQSIKRNIFINTPSLFIKNDTTSDMELVLGYNLQTALKPIDKDINTEDFCGYHGTGDSFKIIKSNSLYIFKNNDFSELKDLITDFLIKSPLGIKLENSNNIRLDVSLSNREIKSTTGRIQSNSLNILTSTKNAYCCMLHKTSTHFINYIIIKSKEIYCNSTLETLPYSLQFISLQNVINVLVDDQKSIFYVLAPDLKQHIALLYFNVMEQTY